jgi:hypothetical protein
MTMQVTEVDIGLVKPKDGPIAFASVVLGDQLSAGSIRSASRLGSRSNAPLSKS